jgi:hypothetical protein
MSTSGQGLANLTFSDEKSTSVYAYSTIDVMGIANACNNQVFDAQNRICNCDGSLPEFAWGRKIQNRDPCGLQERDNKTWIAGPIIGGVALFGIFATLSFLWQHRRIRKSRLQSRLPSHDILPISNPTAAGIPLGPQVSASSMSNRATAGWDASTPSESSLASDDSGAVLLESPAARRQRLDMYIS